MAERGDRARRRLLAQPVYLWLLLLVVAPNASLIAASVQQSAGGAIIPVFTLENYGRALERASYTTLIGTTILTAAASALIACAIGYPMAYYVSRKVRRFKLPLVLLVIIPLWVSLLIRVFAWKIILGEGGVLNSFLVSTGILDEPTRLLLYTRFTVFLTFVYVAIPYVFVTSYSALERIPNALIEASRDAGASPWQTFRRVVWPLSRRGVMIGFALAFLLAVGDYVSPSMVGGLSGTMMGMIIASQFGLAGNWPFGAALSVLLMFAVMLVLAGVVVLARTRGTLETGSTTAPEGIPWSRLPAAGRLARVVALVLFASCYALLYGPLLVIVLFSFNASTLQALPMAGFTLDWYRALAGDEQLQAAVVRSLLVGACVAGGSAIMGTAFALLLTRVRIFAARSVEFGITLPLMLPGIVLGISLALTFHYIGLPSGFLTVVVGQMTFVVPVVMVVVAARLRGLDPSLEQASADLGAGWAYTFRRVLLPLIGSAVLAGALLGFTLSFDEVTVTLFLTGVEPTLPVFIWNQLRFGFTPTINAAFTLIGLVSLTLVVIASQLLNAKSGSRTFGQKAIGELA